VSRRQAATLTRLVRIQCLIPQLKNYMNHNKDDDFEFRSFGSNPIRAKTVAQVHEFYISGEITSPETYVEMFDAIRHARENDTVKIYINSFGGDLFSAIQFMRVMADSEAYVVCSVEGACMSAATMIFLAADSVEITPHSSFMIHNYSSGAFGKGGELFHQIQHERKWSEKLLKEVYEDFLTEAEIQHVLENKDLWMDVDEVVLRMEEREKLQKSRVAKG